MKLKIIKNEINIYFIINLIEIINRRNNNKNEPTNINEENTTQCIPWVIDNKYYTADVQFWIDSATPDHTDAATKETWDEIGHVIDAFIFVFDLNKVRKGYMNYKNK